MERDYVVCNVRKLADDMKDTRTVEFVASDESRDSHGTVIPSDKWDLTRFNTNGIIGYQHNVYGDMCGNEDPDKVIGTGEAFVENKQLIVRITFEPAEINPLAEKIFQKVLYGTLKAVSVGFMPTQEGHWGEGDESREGKNATYYFDGQELLEVCIVNIPSNKNALKRDLRSNTVDALHFVYRALDGKVRYSEIEEMKVRDLMDLLQCREQHGVDDHEGKRNAYGNNSEGVRGESGDGSQQRDIENADVLLAEAAMCL